MKSLITRLVTVLVSGFVVLLLLSLPLFWGRWLCEIILRSMMPDATREVNIQPSGLVPSELENDPNVIIHSKVEARMRPAATWLLGFVDYFESRMAGRYSNLYYYNHKHVDDDDWIYFDEKTGQIVCRYTCKEEMPDKTILLRQLQLYAGPEGVSETADKTLGRFISPIIDKRGWSWQQSLALYDKKLNRFFTINFEERTLIKGPQLSKDDFHKPVQIGLLDKNPSFLTLHWQAPQIKASEEDARKEPYIGRDTIPIVERDYLWHIQRYMLVLNETGRIDLLDRETLEFAGVAGHLPAPKSLFPSKIAVKPNDLLGYEVMPLVLSNDSKYRGLFAASVNREGTAMTVAVFDEEGKLIRSDYTQATKYRGSRTETTPSSKAVFFAVPWAPTLTIAKFLLENLHPPILSLASYIAADSIEAGAGHRALFILPNSFIAMKGRDVSQNTAERFFTALLIILPALILAILLTWRVSEDATAVGLSENAKLFWMLATIAFGLVAYITYRLTRPEITQVSCANCGKLRRPDMEKCHRCGSKWDVPELTPPAWRVIDT